MAEWHVMLEDRILDRFWIQEGDTINIGRGKSADVNLDNVAVSRHHARLQMRKGQCLLTDLVSVNGTFVNGRKIKGTTPVTGADRIEIGKFRFVLHQASQQTSSHLMPSDFEGTIYLPPKEKRGWAPDAREPRLTVTEGRATPEELYLKDKETVTLGKNSTRDVCIPGWLVGKIQCYILVRDHKHYLVHHSGWKRTTLNGRKVRGEERLHRGDTIGVGGTKLRFG
jgi:pSer/pThr/pTyr-binding forkhead associated (FHA) protein